jgi:hypothetical protein
MPMCNESVCISFWSIHEAWPADQATLLETDMIGVGGQVPPNG